MNVIDEFLVKLGVAIDTGALLHMDRVLSDMARKTDSTMLSMGASIIKWQTVAVGAFASVAAAIVDMTDKVAMADQQYRLFGMSMYMNQDAAKKLKITMDALGQPLGMIAWDKELSSRAQRLLELQDVLQGQLDKENYEENMIRLRELRFQLTELHVNFQYLQMAIVNGLVQAFGPQLDMAIQKLQEFNLWFANHLPEIRDKIDKYLVPILKDAWRILSDIVELVGGLASAFADVINTIAGDRDALDPAMSRWERFARAIEHAANAVAYILDKLVALEKFLIPAAGTLGGAALGAKIGSMFGPEGTLIGGVAGAIGGGAVDIYRATGRSSQSLVPQTMSGDAQEKAQQAAALAQRVSQQTGIPADLLWSQWAHETGGFTNRGSTDLNNLAGVRIPGTSEYRSFSSLDEFGNYYAHMMRPGGRYSGIQNATTPEDFAARLKQGGYYEDTQSNYTAGMERWEKQYGAVSSKVEIGNVNIHIMQPGADGEEIQRRVAAGISNATDAQVTRNLNEFAGVYG